MRGYGGDVADGDVAASTVPAARVNHLTQAALENQHAQIE